MKTSPAGGHKKYLNFTSVIKLPTLLYGFQYSITFYSFFSVALINKYKGK